MTVWGENPVLYIFLYVFIQSILHWTGFIHPSSHVILRNPRWPVNIKAFPQNPVWMPYLLTLSLSMNSMLVHGFAQTHDLAAFSCESHTGAGGSNVSYKDCSSGAEVLSSCKSGSQALNWQHVSGLCCITHILSDVFSHCVIVECWCKMMIEAISLWFWKTDTQTWHLLLMWCTIKSIRAAL